jgi:Holliday junction resolvasome RuvABC endonuclease subunit
MAVKWIVSVDAALRNVGYAVHDNVGTLIESGNIATSNGTLDHDAIDDIVDRFFRLLDKYFVDPAIVAVYVEDILFARHGKGTARAEVTGVLKWNLRQQGVKTMYGVEPKTWQSYLFHKHSMKPARPGGGRVRTEDIKAAVMQLLHRHYNFYTDNDNIADAVGIGKFALAHAIEKRRFSVRALAKTV